MEWIGETRDFFVIFENFVVFWGILEYFGVYEYVTKNGLYLETRFSEKKNEFHLVGL